MAVLLWLALLSAAFVVALASSAKLRKSAFIWFSYATITGWYYFRVLHKKYAGGKEPGSPRAASPPSSASDKDRAPSSAPRAAAEGSRDPDLVYFEPREVIERRQQEQLERLERSGTSERSSHMSDSGSSGGSDGAATPSKRKRSFFHSRRKAAAEEAVRRVSDASSADLLSSSGVSEPNGPVTPGRNSATRRTYTGRKKPVSWAE
ncbi:WD repeat-containing protein 6 [Phytophthora cinnamomi]|uniref:WD repeat-containing protein 6 n=1 Tax=Phytophthora cinnamomi TaxID=4785 RepID=UPI003559A389|nr:WD repeat-containing protein 6 [Phytophthora cinnamomi]